MNNCCEPAPAPFTYYPNCAQRFVRACTDGTGIVVGNVPAAYLFTVRDEENDETPEEAQARANALALEIARYRALQETLTCDTVSEEDLAGCGIVVGRPQPLPCLTICDHNGNTLCTHGDDTIST